MLVLHLGAIINVMHARVYFEFQSHILYSTSYI